MSELEIRAPQDQEGTKSAIRAWLRRPGDSVRAHEALVELETDKVAVEVAAPENGILLEILVEDGDVLPGQVLARFGQAEDLGQDLGQALDHPVPAAALSPSAQTRRPVSRRIASFDPTLRLSPSVRRLCAEHDLDPRAIRGAGRGGRITFADVEQHLAGSARVAEAQIVPHTPMRRRIGEAMAHSLQAAPHVTALFEADCSRILAHRAAHKAAALAGGFPLTYTAYFVAAAAMAMPAAPEVNSRWHEAHLEIFRDVHVGVGAAMPDGGLIVPVLRHAQRLSLMEIAAGLADLTERARLGRLTKADVGGGTFSISNHGVSGTLLAAPIIINQPQSAILGVGKLEKRVIVREIDGQDAIVIRPMAYVTLTIDHRVLNGAQTNAWLTRFVDILETWPLG